MEVNGKTQNGDSITINLKKSYWIFGIVLIILSIFSSLANIRYIFGDKNNGAAVASFDFEPFENMIERKVETEIGKTIGEHNQNEKSHPTIIGALNGIQIELHYMNLQLEEIKKHAETSK